MFFFFIIGTHFFSWGSERTPQQMHCHKCGTNANFIIKKGLRFITLFFIIPIIPISGVKELAQCPACGARFQVSA